MDAKRINEFGFSAEMLEQHKQGVPGEQPKAIDESTKTSEGTPSKTKTPEGTPSKTKTKRKTATEKKDE